MSRIGRLAELVIAPGDIRTADPTRADDIYAGYYVFGGRMVNSEGRPPFSIAPPNPDFARELAGFSWLRHLRAAGATLPRTNARALISDFLSAEPRLRAGPAGEPAVVARRILSWLSQAPFVLTGADADFYTAFMRGLTRDAATLARRAGDTIGQDRLLAGIAMTELALCADLGEAILKRTTAMLSEELGRQIFADGGHIGRNPETLVELLLDLLPLRHTFAARNQPAPQALLNAIDRMIPMVRLLRHGDGSLALFNGMGLTEPDHLATVLAYADARGRALLNAPHAGYQRLEAADTVIVVDAGGPPPSSLSQAAHAGCLSFELSVGVHRVVVNCGAPPPGKSALREAARQTAAHSTLTIDDASSCRFAASSGFERLLTGTILSGPRNVTAERREQADATILDASHDGYGPVFGLRHQRRLVLTRDGRRLFGEDRLEALPGAAQRKPERFDLRFHLHPDIRVEPTEGTNSLRLFAGPDEIVFEANAPVSVEESVLFAAATGVRPSRQIVLSGGATDGVNVVWSFSRQ